MRKQDHGKKPFVAFGLLALVAVAAMSAVAAPSPSWNDRWWLAKASRTLRGGDSLAPSENPDALLTQGREKVVEQFVADPRFADTMLDFNLVFLGFRQDRIKKENGNYRDAIYEFPHAISAARALLSPSGDYFSLFDLEHPHYFGPLPRPQNIEAGDEKLSSFKLRQETFKRLQDDLNRIIALASQIPAPTPAQVCAEIITHEEKFVFDNPFNLPRTIPRNVMRVSSWYGSLEDVCYDDPLVPQDYVKLLTDVRDKNAVFFAKLAAFEPSGYTTPDLFAIRTLDLADMQLGYKHTQLTFAIQRALPNSSTNFDRKRGAYILKRFFCDDLTPVNVEAPPVHAGNRHASEPSCFACHYKLDPMAGFFRDFGRNFRDYSARKNIFFDDGVMADRVEYGKNWQPGPDAARPWNVGYVRSTTHSEVNSYGSTYTDLLAMLKTAPEVRRCLMKRLFEYLVSDRQVLDGDFLDYLAEEFNRDVQARGSAQAIKQAASRIVLSRSFSTPDADSGTCYDFRPGHVPGSGVPCRVASILNQHCVKCHSSTQDNGQLDLKSWKPWPTQAMTGFPHLAEDGVTPVPLPKTYEQILERIASTDSDFRMPSGADMPSTDRQELYRWISEQLAKLSPRATK